MTTEKKLAPTEILTVECRIAFPSLFERKPRVKGSDKLTYQATLLFPPGTDLKPFQDAMKAAMLKKFDKVVALPAKNNPLKDAGEKSYGGFEKGWTYVATHADRQPAVVSRTRVPVTDPEMIYPGLWVKAYLNAFAWDHPANGKGVSFGLNAIQIVRDGERFDGRKNAEQVFEALEEEGGNLIGGDLPF